MFTKAHLKYLDDIIKIERSLFEQPWSEIHFRKDLKHKASYNVVCIEDLNCIGYLFGYLVKDEFHLNNIAIDQKYQQQGFGSKMINFVIDDLKNKRINRIMLEVRCDNYSAIKLYDSFGFNKVSIRKDYYKKGKDAFLYNLDIK